MAATVVGSPLGSGWSVKYGFPTISSQSICLSVGWRRNKSISSWAEFEIQFPSADVLVEMIIHRLSELGRFLDPLLPLTVFNEFKVKPRMQLQVPASARNCQKPWQCFTLRSHITFPDVMRLADTFT